MSRMKDLFGDTPYDLYGGTPPHVRYSETSKAAAESVVQSSATLRAKVLDFTKKQDGATCDEVEYALGLRHQTASARLRELVLLGKLTDSRIKRKTRSGRQATVWIAT